MVVCSKLVPYERDIHDVNKLSFKFEGKEYQVAKVSELSSDQGHRRLEVTTKDNKKFELVYKESIFRWVVSKPLPVRRKKPSVHFKVN